MVAEAETERLPGAVPIACKPGDVAITNGQAVHGSIANTSPDWRVTVNFGFHRRRSVLGMMGGGVHNTAAGMTRIGSVSAAGSLGTRPMLGNGGFRVRRLTPMRRMPMRVGHIAGMRLPRRRGSRNIICLI
jgi:hypothetical protein